ncbi:hypothetical protein BC830DRAFT_1113791 [Chytriomyces sp. MP71]|nr:hypothetical protein BC830DRAFT_1113791 [Chytriomyces sp. MP71]
MERERGIVVRPPNRLAEWLPDYVLMNSIYVGLPDTWQQQLNLLCLVPVLVLFVHCILEQRWVPSQWRASRESERSRLTIKAPVNMKGVWIPPPSVLLFWAMLGLYTLYYVVELDSTQMIFRNQAVAWHHYFAIIVFFGYTVNANVLSVSSLLPFVLHTVYWAFLYDDAPRNWTRAIVLLAYNLSLVLCGLLSFFIAGALRAKSSFDFLHTRHPAVVRTHPMTLLMPFASVFIAAANHAQYCTSDGGATSVCVSRLFFSQHATENALGVALGVGAWLAGLAYMSGFGFGCVSAVRVWIEAHADAFTETRYVVRSTWTVLEYVAGGGRVSPVGWLCRLCGFGRIEQAGVFKFAGAVESASIKDKLKEE